MPTKPRSRPLATDDEVRVRRAYFECRFGQLHVRTAFPTSGGFDEHTTLVCFHHSPRSGRVFEKFLPVIARDRSVYAPDIPGHGESDAPPSRPTIADYAAAMADFFDAMRFRQIDLLGHQSGALVAAELGILRPEQVRRVVLVSVPVFSAEEREVSNGKAGQAPAEDGAHLLREWQRQLQARSGGVTLEECTVALAERFQSGAAGSWGLHAAHHYAANERLPLLRQPTLIVRPKDELWDAGQRARHLVRGSRLVDLPEQGAGVFVAAPDLLARHAREFLNAT
ncbi:MAG TPA: alpha/beta hydrolase [Steroidobacteraceae bacterium]|nr:alpha/beta hydrolase [Steroidobacteraceae bacterium]